MNKKAFFLGLVAASMLFACGKSPSDYVYAPGSNRGPLDGIFQITKGSLLSSKTHNLFIENTTGRFKLYMANSGASCDIGLFYELSYPGNKQITIKSKVDQAAELPAGCIDRATLESFAKSVFTDGTYTYEIGRQNAQGTPVVLTSPSGATVEFLQTNKF